MNRINMLLLLCLTPFVVVSQPVQGSLVASLSHVDRLNLVKTSIEIPTWHEKEFWPLYEEFLQHAETINSQLARTQSDLVNVSNLVSNDDALNYIHNFIQIKKAQYEIRQKYYQQIGSRFNGCIAFQFIQNEILLSMMDDYQLYDNSNYKKFRFHPAFKGDVKTSKYKLLAGAVGVTGEDHALFLDLYQEYEKECDEKLGTNYDLIGMFAGPPSDYAPGLAKRLGQNLLSLQKRENEMREKYINLMIDKMGPVIASRFVVWEDYFSTMSKMHAWADLD